MGWTPLHIAALNDRTGVVTVLLEAGADREAQDETKLTPLHLAGAEREDRYSDSFNGSRG